MAMKKNNIITLALMLVLAPNVLADGANNLVQLDLKKSSNDSVNVTLFTSNNYSDNVLVRKKSDNKYVILIPKIQSSGFTSSNLNGVKELISGVDVKTVNDTNGGYTKVTLITTKPLDIKTSTRKSAPVTAEQKEYKTLIAQANAIKNTVSQPVPQNTVKPLKTEVTVNKAPAVSKPKTETKAEVKKEAQPKNTSDIKLEELNPEKIQRQIRREHLTEMINEARQEKMAEDLPAPVVEIPQNQLVNEDIQNVVSKVSVKHKIKTKLSGMMHKAKHSKAVKIGFILFALFMVSKLFRRKQVTVSRSVIENLKQNPASAQQTDELGSILNSKELSWQDKYKLYMDASPAKRAGSKGAYKFIKSQNSIDKKRHQLEKLLDESENILSAINTNINPEIVEVQNEDDVIHKNIKFRAFDNQPVSLKMSDRMKSRFKKYEVEIPLTEQKTIDLGESALHTNPRSLRNANLKIEDIDNKRIKFKNQDYIMSSVDEYFAILDKEQSEQKAAEVKPVEVKPSVTNPIAQNRPAYNKGLIVKSGFNIDEEKGFYLVNKNGQNALIGKIKDEVFVLKKFDSNVTNPIQVRHDNANVYMVKAGGFKSLVEVNPDKMGVLIEL